MQPDETLDLLLTERIHGGAVAALPRERWQVDAELAPLLAAADRLDALRGARPSAAFADDLERRLLARVAELEQPNHIASAGAAAGARLTPRPLRAARVARSHRIPTRLAWISVAAALALSIGLGVFTAQAAPGGPLYPVRELAQHVAAQAFPSPTAAAQSALARASADLGAYQSDIARGDTPAALVALAALRADDAQAAQDIAALPDASARKAMEERQAQFRQGAATDLRASLAVLDWRARAQVTDALRAWGATRLRVTQARLLSGEATAQDSHASADAGAVIVVVSGDGFTPGSQALVNGAPAGVILAQSPAQLKVRVDASTVAGQGLVIGVETSDGAVAITMNILRDDHAAPGHAPTPGSNGNHGGGDGAVASPAPSPTEQRGPGQGG